MCLILFDAACLSEKKGTKSEFPTFENPQGLLDIQTRSTEVSLNEILISLLYKI